MGLEARSQKSRCQQGHTPSEAIWGGSFQTSSSSWWPRPHHLHPHVAIFPLRLCPNIPLKRTLVLLASGLPLLQRDIIFTNYVCSSPTPK